MIKHRDDKLTKEEELALGVKIQKMKKIKEEKEEHSWTGSDYQIVSEGEVALETLISNYIKLARKIASDLHKKTGTRYDFEDLMQDAISALITSALNYDPSKDCRLSTYAFYGISKKVSSTINYQRLVRMPENKMGEYVKISEAQKNYNLLTDKEKSAFKNELDYVYKNSGVKKEEVDLVLSNMQPQVSLNAKLFDGEGELIDLLANQEAFVDESATESLSLAEDLDPTLQKVLNTLNPIERQLIAYEFEVFTPEKEYSEFLEENEINERSAKRMTNKAIRAMAKYAKDNKLSISLH